MEKPFLACATRLSTSSLNWSGVTDSFRVAGWPPHSARIHNRLSTWLMFREKLNREGLSSVCVARAIMLVSVEDDAELFFFAVITILDGFKQG